MWQYIQEQSQEAHPAHGGPWSAAPSGENVYLGAFRYSRPARDRDPLTTLHSSSAKDTSQGGKPHPLHRIGL